MDGWILLRRLVQLEHLAVLIIFPFETFIVRRCHIRTGKTALAKHVGWD